MSSDTIPFSTYLLERLKQCKVKQVFGVPGDFNLEFLDYIENDKDLNWVGNANELNAAYAADGYARVKGSLAAIVTTFGVGELSALCGIAGSMAERLPIVHIVGVPSTSLQSAHALLHHTLGNGNFTDFSKMSAHISAATAVLDHDSNSNWTAELDRVLRIALVDCRPVYITLPTDLVHAKVDRKALDKPLPHPHSAPPPSAISATADKALEPGSSSSKKSDSALEHVVEEITHRFEHAKRPVVVIDACAQRFGMQTAVRELVEAGKLRFFETPMGKSTCDERHHLYGGAYAGANSLEHVREEVEDADFVLYVGALKSDFNSGSFSVNIASRHTIELHSFTTNIGYASFPSTDMRAVLPLLIPAFAEVVKRRQGSKTPGASDHIQTRGKEEREDAEEVPEDRKDGVISHKYFWPRMGKWFEDKDVVLTETGTSSFGLINVPLPSHAKYLSQVLWGAIGWSVGACLGASLAASEEADRRTVLFVGDGSLQLTIQEIGTMLRRGLCPYLFVLNNDGYEIERQIHGETAKYNDIQMYDHQLLLPMLAGKGAKKNSYQSYEIHTREELEALLNDKDFAKPDRLRLIEVFLPRGDAPAPLLKQAKLTAEANARV